ncbi:MAG: hypothetical protein Q3974_05925, partial [Rothia sp. (in: high G+C Gram-positive bacteria)]|nr:hypothetical protein [Rothia sp. (in: high G+C Gram-positive bacteria)]
MSLGMFLIGSIATYFQAKSGTFPTVGIIILVTGCFLLFFGLRFLKHNKVENNGNYGTLDLFSAFSRINIKLLAITLCTAIPGFI